MTLDQLELHDAKINGVRVDYAAKTASIDVEYFSDEQSFGRTAASINFDAIESISQIVDLDQLACNAFEGNVSHWIPAQGDAPTYIYLTQGCIAIKAGRVWVSGKALHN